MWTLQNNPIAKIESNIKKSTKISLSSLCCFRIIFSLFTIVFSWHRYTWLEDVPDAFFDPPLLSLASLLNAFPPKPFFQSLDLAIGLCSITLLLGLFTQLSTRLLLTMLIIGSTFQYSLGKIDHGDALYLSTLFAMCFQDWGSLLSVDALYKKSHSAHGHKIVSHKTVDLSFLAILIAFGFLTAGLGKALNWIDLDLTTNGFLSWFYDGYFNQGRDRLLAPFVLKINAPLLWEIIDTSAVIFELGALIAILSRRRWYAWLTIACIFHLANCLLLNIDFEMNAIVYLAFIPWAELPIIDTTINRIICQPKQLKWLLAGFTTFGTAAFICRQQLPYTKLPLLETIGIQDKLLVSCGIWTSALFLFLLSFKTYISFSTQPIIQQSLSISPVTASSTANVAKR
ncbi:MAG: hypothetical protein AAF635_08385 [Cyanobacteria bacterium P01_C01_bin.69]